MSNKVYPNRDIAIIDYIEPTLGDDWVYYDTDKLFEWLFVANGDGFVLRRNASSIFSHPEMLSSFRVDVNND